MRNHVWRPLIVICALLALFFIVRHFLVPSDFKTYDKGFMYGYHRKSNEAEWEKFRVKYKGKEYCSDCHDEFTRNIESPHKVVQCESCHGPAIDHPESPEKLSIDRTRELCLRCHAKLLYSTSMRSEIKGIDPEKHNPTAACFTCHDPHHPNLEERKP